MAKKKKRFIDGIYNYCDRWCERCAHTARCRTYAMGARHGDIRPAAIDSEPLWRNLSARLTRTRELMEMEAAERGLDLDEMREDAQLKWVSSPHSWRSEDMPLLRDSHVYAMRLRKCMSDIEGAAGMDEEPGTESRPAAPDPEQSEVVSLADALSVVRWYEFFIHVKLVRTLGVDEIDEDDDDPDLEEFRRSDQLGSAKTVLIGLDRSLAAWDVLREAMPERADQVVDFMLHLERLRRGVETCFPDARNFARPGLDGSSPAE